MPFDDGSIVITAVTSRKLSA